jgi:hypothetical protein
MFSRPTPLITSACRSSIERAVVSALRVRGGACGCGCTDEAHESVHGRRRQLVLLGIVAVSFAFLTVFVTGGLLLASALGRSDGQRRLALFGQRGGKRRVRDIVGAHQVEPVDQRTHALGQLLGKEAARRHSLRLLASIATIFMMIMTVAVAFEFVIIIAIVTAGLGLARRSPSRSSRVFAALRLLFLTFVLARPCPVGCRGGALGELTHAAVQLQPHLLEALGRA